MYFCGSGKEGAEISVFYLFINLFSHLDDARRIVALDRALSSTLVNVLYVGAITGAYSNAIRGIDLAMTIVVGRQLHAIAL